MRQISQFGIHITQVAERLFLRATCLECHEGGTRLLIGPNRILITVEFAQSGTKVIERPAANKLVNGRDIAHLAESSGSLLEFALQKLTTGAKVSDFCVLGFASSGKLDQFREVVLRVAIVAHMAIREALDQVTAPSQFGRSSGRKIASQKLCHLSRCAFAGVALCAKETKAPVQDRLVNRIAQPLFNQLNGMIGVSALILKTGLGEPLFERGPWTAFTGKKEEQNRTQQDAGYPPPVPLPPPVGPSEVPWPEEHICTRNIRSVREWWCTLISASRMTPNFGIQINDP